MKIYVGNLSFQTSKDDVDRAFSQFGTITDIHLPTDRETGRPRGFGFVTFDSHDAGEAAIKAMDGNSLDGRNLKVNEARPRD